MSNANVTTVETVNGNEIRRIVNRHSVTTGALRARRHFTSTSYTVHVAGRVIHCETLKAARAEAAK